jgi:hypothetical protein
VVISDSASDDAKLYEAIGRFTVTFATAEMCADALAAIIFNGYAGKTLVSPVFQEISLRK